MPRGSQRKRGRPPKFGRAAELISLTLPRDVITWLETIDGDMAWAIVKLHERATKGRVFLEDPRIEAPQREALRRLRTLLKQWRQDGIQFEPRSIIVAHSKG